MLHPTQKVLEFEVFQIFQIRGIPSFVRLINILNLKTPNKGWSAIFLVWCVFSLQIGGTDADTPDADFILGLYCICHSSCYYIVGLY